MSRDKISPEAQEAWPDYEGPKGHESVSLQEARVLRHAFVSGFDAAHEAQAAEIERLRRMLFRECDCMKIQQDESCPVGYPSLLCVKCDGIGHINLLSEHKAVLAEVVAAIDDQQPRLIDYTNWRGERSNRQVKAVRLWHGSTKWHPEPQVLLLAFDVSKLADRDFALSDIHSITSATALMGKADA